MNLFTDEEVKEIYLQKIEEYTNTLFERDNLPGGVKVALAKLIKYDPDSLMASQSLHDMSTTYHSPEEVYGNIAKDLEPYCRPHLIGNKRKRRYIDGR